VDRTQAAVDVPAFDERAEGAHDLGLERARHRQVGVRPLAEHAEAAELLHLDGNELRRVLAAGLAQRGALDGHALLAELGGDVVLDRHAVVVPARDERHVLALQQVHLVERILPDLVRRGPEVDVAVRVGRAVVQHERARRIVLERAALALEAREDVRLLPEADPVRLSLGQVGLHREVGVRQVQPCRDSSSSVLAREKKRKRPDESWTRRGDRSRCHPTSPRRCRCGPRALDRSSALPVSWADVPRLHRKAVRAAARG
jgi:hypothetical protein